MNMENESNVPSGAVRTKWSLLLIVLTSLLAFGGAVRSDFYMDDYMFILDTKGERPADRYYTLPVLGAVTDVEKIGAKEVTLFETIPNALWVATDRLVSDPVSGSWVYHLWNVVFHTLTACAAFLAGREVLRVAGVFSQDQFNQRAALTGALLFACHPLCSEPVNYAKCLNHVCEAFFGLLAIWQGSRWLQSGERKSAVWATVLLFVATISYMPGLAISAGWFILIAVAWWGRGGSLKFGRLSAGVKIGVACVGVLGVLLYGSALVSQNTHWSDQRLAHILTQSRIFWDYLTLSVLPAGLCSDHLVAWSVPGKDVAAAFALLSIVILVLCLGAVLWKGRKPLVRAISLLLLMAFVPLLLRFLYINQEAMVEYRTYPAIPWLMLLASCALTAMMMRLPRLQYAVAAVLVLTFCALSMQRTSVWSSKETLLADVLQKYPLHYRARTQLQGHYIENGDNSGVMRVHRELVKAVQSLKEWNDSTESRQFGMKETSMALIRSSQWMIYAIADKDGSAAALGWAKKVIPAFEMQFPQHFRGDLTLLDPGNTPNAWPLLMARNTVRDHAEEIDAARVARKNAAALPAEKAAPVTP